MSAARAFAVTFMSSCSGGFFAIIFSYATVKSDNGRRYADVGLITNGILAAQVSVTGCAAFIELHDAVIIGAIGSIISCLITNLTNFLKIDDPVGAVAVHFGGGFWGGIAVGLFSQTDFSTINGGDLNMGKKGLFNGGGMELLGKQLVGISATVLWSAATTYIILTLINIFIPIRCSAENEWIGLDYSDFGIKNKKSDYNESSKSTRVKPINISVKPQNFGDGPY